MKILKAPETIFEGLISRSARVGRTAPSIFPTLQAGASSSSILTTKSNVSFRATWITSAVWVFLKMAGSSLCLPNSESYCVSAKVVLSTMLISPAYVGLCSTTW